MFEFIFSRKRVPKYSKIIKEEYSEYKKGIVPLLWTEHCIECAAPRCYLTCPRFQKRSDGNCIRIVNGIMPIVVNNKLGAQIEFRSWAKIESQFKIRPLSSKQYGNYYSVINRLGYALSGMAKHCPEKLSKFIIEGWFSYRQKGINRLIRKCQPARALTLVGVIVNEEKETMLLVDIKTHSKHLFRQQIVVPVGKSDFSISIPPFEDYNELHFINLHPLDAEQHVLLTFEFLELIPTDITLGKKIKCVIWDLDNTLWNGILIEDRDVKVNDEFVRLIKHFTDCGVVNSIVSKNNETEVLEKLKEFGLEEYFVFKKINWEPKSLNIGLIIKQMNINPDTVVFVDDNLFERTEVSLKNPAITCIDPSEMIEFSQCGRFNMIVTEDSKKRLSTYKMLEKMKSEEESWVGDIDDFLYSCHIKVNLSNPEEHEISRCYELLQRTNQLNSSGRRLSLNEVKDIIHSGDYDCYVLRSSDKFGDYGLVGFLIIDKRGDTPCIMDFVISCRVANKKIEPSVVNFLANRYCGQLLFNYKKTLLNGPMFKIIEELRMNKIAERNEIMVYLLNFDENYPKIVDINMK